MVDIVNQRVNTAQQELEKRAEKLKSLVSKTRGKPQSEAFKEGIKLLEKLIFTQSRIIDNLVFEVPETRLEQHRNLILTTGAMNQTVEEGIKSSTEAIDAMLKALEQLSR